MEYHAKMSASLSRMNKTLMTNGHRGVELRTVIADIEGNQKPLTIEEAIRCAEDSPMGTWKGEDLIAQDLMEGYLHIIG